MFPYVIDTLSFPRFILSINIALNSALVVVITGIDILSLPISYNIISLLDSSLYSVLHIGYLSGLSKIV